VLAFLGYTLEVLADIWQNTRAARTLAGAAGA
jgi:hypothetical protein